MINKYFVGGYNIYTPQTPECYTPVLKLAKEYIDMHPKWKSGREELFDHNLGVCMSNIRHWILDTVQRMYKAPNILLFFPVCTEGERAVLWSLSTPKDGQHSSRIAEYWWLHSNRGWQTWYCWWNCTIASLSRPDSYRSATPVAGWNRLRGGVSYCDVRRWAS